MSHLATIKSASVARHEECLALGTRVCRPVDRVPLSAVRAENLKVVTPLVRLVPEEVDGRELLVHETQAVSIEEGPASSPRSLARFANVNSKAPHPPCMVMHRRAPRFLTRRPR